MFPPGTARPRRAATLFWVCLWTAVAARESHRWSRSRCQNDNVCPENEYCYEAEKRCCSNCPPGFYRKDFCTSKNDTSCEPCNHISYNEDWNHSYECTVCVGTCANDQVEVQSCSRTRRQKCECKPGMYCKSPSLNYCDQCVHYTRCTMGEELIDAGNHRKDNVCKPCPTGTFSNVPGAKCQPHTNCSLLNKHLVKGGTASEDAVCGQVITSTIATSILTIFTLRPNDEKLNLTTVSTAVTTPKGNRQMVDLFLAIGLILAFLLILIVSSLLFRRKEYFKSLFLSNKTKGPVYIVTPYRIYLGMEPGNSANADQEDPIIQHPESHIHFPQQESVKSQNTGESHIYPVEEEGKLFRDPVPAADY
ncbi:tumor necrosis factor receptor superfamily member 9-like [Chiloscyllium punctatum]|uniref:tumor necrosis factor receptor superfamily member 9-like n=1 Tax=Chiloscyllium punctatum TaxID=137246 RepID=UPI003B631CD5